MRNAAKFKWVQGIEKFVYYGTYGSCETGFVSKFNAAAQNTAANLVYIVIIQSKTRVPFISFIIVIRHIHQSPSQITHTHTSPKGTFSRHSYPKNTIMNIHKCIYKSWCDKKTLRSKAYKRLQDNLTLLYLFYARYAPNRKQVRNFTRDLDCKVNRCKR